MSEPTEIGPAQRVRQGIKEIIDRVGMSPRSAAILQKCLTDTLELVTLETRLVEMERTLEQERAAGGIIAQLNKDLLAERDAAHKLLDATGRIDKDRRPLEQRISDLVASDDVSYGKTILELRQELKRAQEALARVETWTRQHGPDLVPPGDDSYGEGKRDAKKAVARLLHATPQNEEG